MTDEEIMDLSRQVDYHQLMEYRKAVGQQTLTLLKNLTFSDLGKKVRREDLERLVSTGLSVRIPTPSGCLISGVRKMYWDCC